MVLKQEPTLFKGSLRFNLDPFGTHSDEALWNSLELVSFGQMRSLTNTGMIRFKAQLKDVVGNTPGGLDSLVQKAGSNLSVGQKQLICLARAILKKSKILIIDEATANLDYECVVQSLLTLNRSICLVDFRNRTDTIIQKAIKQSFKDCTIITIAHRLHSLMDSDKILVYCRFNAPHSAFSSATFFVKCLSNGYLKSTGRPYELAIDPNTILSSFIQKLSEDEQVELIEAARTASSRHCS